MGPDWRRRELLAVAMALVSGCGMPRSPDVPQGVQGRADVTKSPAGNNQSDTQSVLEKIRFDSSSISTEWISARQNGLSPWTDLYTNGSRYAGRLEVEPKISLTRRTSGQPSDIEPVVVESLSLPNNYPIRGYRTVYKFYFPVIGLPMRFRWTVFGFPGKPYVILHAKLTNVSTRSVTLDQDEGNRHAGISMLRGVNLDGATISQQSLQFSIQGEEAYRFSNVGIYAVFDPGYRTTIFGPEKGITYGYLAGDTAPRMWVTRERALDFTVNGTTLQGGESIQYYFFVGAHNGGSQAPTLGKTLFKEAKELV